VIILHFPALFSGFTKEHIFYQLLVIFFRYQLFFLQASSLRRNPFIRIANGSNKKGTGKGKPIAICHPNQTTDKAMRHKL
jgi:hypothetical protein